MATSFLVLPSETRMEIYSYLLVTETGISPFIRRARGTLHLHPAILRTCKSIFEEAASVLTQRNLFIYQSYYSPARDDTLFHKSDRSLDIIKNQYHCTPTLAHPRPITSRSHRIRHLELRVDGQGDYKTAMTMLNTVLAPHNMLKTLEVEMWDIWERDRLHGVLTKLASAPNHIAITIKIYERSWSLKLERGPGRFGKSMAEWNQTSERRLLRTKSEITTIEQWGRLWKRGFYRMRSWTLSPCTT